MSLNSPGGSTLQQDARRDLLFRKLLSCLLQCRFSRNKFSDAVFQPMCPRSSWVVRERCPCRKNCRDCWCENGHVSWRSANVATAVKATTACAPYEKLNIKISVKYCQPIYLHIFKRFNRQILGKS